jgi:hypothetical protein
MRLIVMCLAALQFLAIGARADAIDDSFRKHLEAGTYEAGVAEIGGLAGADQARAGAAQGALQFMLAIEHLGKSFYRYGLSFPEQRGMMMVPVLRFPVPDNPSPEKIDYAALRGIFEKLVTDLDAAEASLAKLGDAEVKLPANLGALRIDFNADGQSGPDETVAGVLDRMMGGQMNPAQMPDMSVNFDTADVYWMRGYSRFISAFAQFMLAHDFEPTFQKTFHLFFPRAGLATGDLLGKNSSMSPDAGEMGTIGDAVAFIHLMSWPVSDSAKLSDVRVRLLAMADMSRKSWAAALREIDNDREWLPNPKQTQAITGTTNSSEVINGWLAVMEEFSAILEGRKLLPHWRFDKGMNVKRMFEEQKTFDLVLLVAGTDAVHYLEDGPVSTGDEWNNLMSAFQGNFLGYAIWFN